nr:MAG TPA: hypothetical protein [Caudoviricetes sp.]
MISIENTSISTILSINHNSYIKSKRLENKGIIRSSRGYLYYLYIRIQNSV